MITIENSTLNLILTQDSETTIIRKDNCRVLVFGDIVRLTDFEFNIYEFDYTTVSNPSEASAEALGDTLNDYLNNTSGGGGIPELPTGKIFIGNDSNDAEDRFMSGDVTITKLGVASIKSSVALTGSPTAPTQTAGDNSTNIATTAYVDNAGIGNYNGKLSVTVASNNITVALKHLSGADPSVASPVYIIINGTLRTVTAALSITRNAGTNWFGYGLNFETDYFAYLGYNATDGVVIGFSPIIGERYGNFSTTTTAWNYLAVSTTTNAAANDAYVVIGRFAATLGVTASFNWSVPTYTPDNLIQYPIYETRWIDYSAASTIVGWSSFTNKLYSYKILNGYFINYIRLQGTSNSTTTTITMPIIPTAISVYHVRADDNGVVLVSPRVVNSTVNNTLTFNTTQTSTLWTALGSKDIFTTHILRYR